MITLKVNQETISGIEDLRAFIIEYHFNAADIAAKLDDCDGWDYLLEKLKKQPKSESLTVDDVINYINNNLLDDLETDGLL